MQNISKAAILLFTCVALLSAPSWAEQEPVPRPLALDQAIAIALDHHGSVAVAAQQASAADAALKEARSAFWPEIAAGWEYRFSRSVGGTRFSTIGGVPVPVPSSAERHQLVVAYQHSLLNSGLTSAQVSRARALAGGSHSAVALARQDLIYLVTERYFTLLRTRRLRTLAEETVKQAQGHLALIQGRIDAGAAAQSDRFPVEAELADVRVKLVAAANDVRLASTVLLNTMGMDIGEEVEPAEPPEPAFGSLQVQDLAQRALASRPDLKEAKAESLAARAELRTAALLRRPLLNLDVGYNLRVDPPPTARDWTVSATIGLPIFDAEARKSRERQARAGLNAARLRQEQLRKDVQSDVHQAYLSLVNAQERIEASAASVAEAKKSLEAFEEKLRLGLAIPTEVVDAQVLYFNSQVQAISARYDWFVASAALQRAVGARYD